MRNLLPVLAVLLACGSPPPDPLPGDDASLIAPEEDAGFELPSDGGNDAGLLPDAGLDAGKLDAGAVDAGTDAGTGDAGFDAGEPDAGEEPDAGPPDSGEPDAGELDAGPVDAGPADAGCTPGTAGCYCRGTATAFVCDDGSTCDQQTQFCVTCGWENGPCCGNQWQGFTCGAARACMKNGASGQRSCITGPSCAGGAGTFAQPCWASSSCCGDLVCYSGGSTGTYCAN